MILETRGNAASVAAALAAHVRSMSRTSALALAEQLAWHGEQRRADLLRSFAERGEQTVDADWWRQGSSCHLGLEPPLACRPGDLWFDPVDTSCAVVQYWPTEPEEDTDPAAVHGWTAVEVMPVWQRLAAHALASDIPSDPGELTNELAFQTCWLFGKGIAGSIDWDFLRAAYDQDMLRRLWGDAPAQLGAFGRISGQMELLTFDYICTEHEESDEPKMVSDSGVDGLPFRTVAFAGSKPGSRGDVVQRVWRG